MQHLIRTCLHFVVICLVASRFAFDCEGMGLITNDFFIYAAVVAEPADSVIRTCNG